MPCAQILLFATLLSAVTWCSEAGVTASVYFFDCGTRLFTPDELFLRICSVFSMKASDPVPSEEASGWLTKKAVSTLFYISGVLENAPNCMISPDVDD